MKKYHLLILAKKMKLINNKIMLLNILRMMYFKKICQMSLINKNQNKKRITRMKMVMITEMLKNKFYKIKIKIKNWIKIIKVKVKIQKIIIIICKKIKLS